MKLFDKIINKIAKEKIEQRIRKLTEKGLDKELEKILKDDWDVKYIMKNAIGNVLEEKIKLYIENNKEEFNKRIDNATQSYELNDKISNIVENQIIPDVRNKVTEEYIEKNMVELLSQMDTKAIGNAITLATAQKLLLNKSDEDNGYDIYGNRR